MAINWLEVLGWGEEQLEDLRYTGFAYLRQGKYDIALPFFEALTVLAPMNSYDLQTLGAIFLQLNKPAEAIPYFNRALEIEVHRAPVLINLAKALVMVGHVNEGLELAMALQNDRDKAIANSARALVMAYT
jgi:predicted Zn-dependent protease